MASKFFELLNKYYKTSTEFNAQAERARKWFRDAAQKIHVDNTKSLTSRDTGMTQRHRLKPQTGLRVANIGRVVLFHYDAKTKEKLPYWDAFPCAIPIRVQRNRFWALNLHYLPPTLRAKLLDGLYAHYKNEHLDERKRLQLDYELLKKTERLRYFKPCIKQYLVSHVRSSMNVVDPKEWDFVVMLPTERFQKKSKEYVWRESRKKINA